MKNYFNKLDLSGMPNRVVSYEQNDSFLLANEQEDFVVSRLRQYYGDIAYWFTTREFFKSMKNDENRIKGDIVGIKYGEVIPFCWIDLKVSKYDPKYVKENGELKFPYRVGTITLGSILWFGQDSVNNWYLCTNPFGTKFCCVKGIDIYNRLLEGKCLLECEEENRKPNSSLIGFANNSYIRKKYEGVNTKDYMPSFIFYEDYK